MIGLCKLCERIQRLWEWHRCFDIFFGDAGIALADTHIIAIDLHINVVVIIKVEVLNGIH